MSDKQKPQEPRSGHASDNPARSPDRRRAQRSGREKGCRVSIPAVVLDAVGIDPNGPPPDYSIAAMISEKRPNRRSVIVRLYPPS